MGLNEKIITSKSNELITTITNLKEKKHRDRKMLFYTEGIKLAKDALNSTLEIETIVLNADNKKSAEYLHGLHIKEEYKNKKNFITYVSEEIYRKITDEISPEGIMCIIKKPEPKMQTDFDKPVFILSSLQDSGNIGTIIRTANALTDSVIILSQDCADIYSSKTLRASMGAVFRHNCIISKDLIKDIANLIKQGYNVWAATLDGNSFPLGSISFRHKSAVVLGNEGSGIPEAIAAACTGSVIIPIRPESESLNVSAAAAILIYEIAKGFL